MHVLHPAENSGKPPPGSKREQACAGEILGGTVGRGDSPCGAKTIHLLEWIKLIYVVIIFVTCVLNDCL